MTTSNLYACITITMAVSKDEAALIHRVRQLKDCSLLVDYSDGVISSAEVNRPIVSYAILRPVRRAIIQLLNTLEDAMGLPRSVASRSERRQNGYMGG